MEQARIGQRTFQVERIERQHRQQGPVVLHGQRGAVYSTMRYFQNREKVYQVGEPLFLVNGRTGAVDPLGSEVVVMETADGHVTWYGAADC